MSVQAENEPTPTEPPPERVGAMGWPAFLELLDPAGAVARMHAAGFSAAQIKAAFRRLQRGYGWARHHLENIIDLEFGIPPKLEDERSDDAARD